MYTKGNLYADRTLKSSVSIEISEKEKEKK